MCFFFFFSFFLCVYLCFSTCTAKTSRRCCQTKFQCKKICVERKVIQVERKVIQEGPPHPPPPHTHETQKEEEEKKRSVHVELLNALFILIAVALKATASGMESTWQLWTRDLCGCNVHIHARTQFLPLKYEEKALYLLACVILRWPCQADRMLKSRI